MHSSEHVRHQLALRKRSTRSAVFTVQLQMGGSGHAATSSIKRPSQGYLWRIVLPTRLVETDSLDLLCTQYSLGWLVRQVVLNTQ